MDQLDVQNSEFTARLGRFVILFSTLEQVLTWGIDELFGVTHNKMRDIIGTGLPFLQKLDIFNAAAMARLQFHDGDQRAHRQLVIDLRSAYEKRNQLLHSGWLGKMETSGLSIKQTVRKPAGYSFTRTEVTLEDLDRRSQEVLDVTEALFEGIGVLDSLPSPG